MMLHALFIHALKSPTKVIASKLVTHAFITAMFHSRFSRSSSHESSKVSKSFPAIPNSRPATRSAFVIKLFRAPHIYNEGYR